MQGVARILQRSLLVTTSSGGERRLVGRISQRPPAADLRFEGGADEPLEQRMRSGGPRLELGVELAAEEVRVVAELDHLDQTFVGRESREDEAVVRERLAVGVVHLPA